MNTSPSTLLKGAEIASGLGAILLGAGIALLAPAWVQSMAWPVLVVGVAVHGAGMGLKYRLEHREGAASWWERLLYWSCWSALVVLLGWLLRASFVEGYGRGLDPATMSRSKVGAPEVP